MINSTNADAYFGAGNHVSAHIWARFSTEQRTAAVTQARRLLARFMGRAMEDDEAAFEEGDQYRDEYAVYEQALWILLNTVFPNAEGSAPLEQAADPDGVDHVAKRDPNAIAPAALAWLDVECVLSRG